jgi:hypothetical protein
MPCGWNSRGGRRSIPLAVFPAQHDDLVRAGIIKKAARLLVEEVGLRLGALGDKRNIMFDALALLDQHRQIRVKLPDALFQKRALMQPMLALDGVIGEIADQGETNRKEKRRPSVYALPGCDHFGDLFLKALPDQSVASRLTPA